MFNPFQQSDKTSSSSPTFCILPWLHLATRTYGAVTPCCVGESIGENLNQTTFSEAWNAPSLRELRRKMLKGDPSPLCRKCYEEEAAGVASHRVRANAYWKDFYSFDEMIQNTNSKGFFNGNCIYLDLRLGNKCNLECNMCSPQETVRWESLAGKIFEYAKTDLLRDYMAKQISHMNHSPSKNWHERNEVIQDISDHLPHLRRVTIAGGEPLLIKEHHKFLEECIDRGEAHHISLHYHTNGTALDSQLFEKWKHFESVLVFISLDDIKDRNRYIRWPTSWKMMERNLDFIDRESPPNVHPMILCTIQIKNIFYFPEFLEWFSGKNFKKIHSCYEAVVHTELVLQPYFLSCQLLPPHVKRLVTDKFEKMYQKYGEKSERFKTLINFMNLKDRSDMLYVFKDYVQALDRVRKTDFSQVFPELSELLEEKR